MTLKEWFKESEQNKQAIMDAKNGRRYIYYRNTKSKIALNCWIEQVVELDDKSGFGAWLER